MTNKRIVELTRKRTKVGLLTKIYNQQRASSRKRSQSLPEYSKKEFIEAILDMPLFHKLHKDWVNSNYSTELIPSIDRDNDFISYTKENITLMTWYENKLKGEKDRREGNSTVCKPVHQFTLTGEYVCTFKSIVIASKELNICRTGITRASTGIAKTSGGYIWNKENAVKARKDAERRYL